MVPLRLPGHRFANDVPGRLDKSREWTAKSALPPGNARVRVLGQRAIKDECLSKMVFFGEGMLRRAIAEFVEHYHKERNHQGVGNRLLRPGPSLPVNDGAVHRQVRLGGLLSFYHRRRRRAAG